MAYEKIRRPEGAVYHYTKRGNLEGIRKDGRLRRFGDRECWVCSSLEDTLRLMELTVMQEGKDRHAHKKGIYTVGKSYRGNLESSDPRYSFHWNGKSSEIYVFEAPIDLLSYISLNKAGWKNHSYVSLCGVGSQALFQTLKDNPALTKIYLCLDHDTAGMEAAARIQEKLAEAGYPDTELYLSHWKDWNEDLKAVHGMEAVPAEEKPPPELAEDRMLQMA